MLYFCTYMHDKNTFMHYEGVELVKFGYTNNLQQRINTYRSTLPLDFVLLATCNGEFDDERNLLRLMNKERHSGEWFYYEGVKRYIDYLDCEPIVYPKIMPSFKTPEEKRLIKEQRQKEIIVKRIQKQKMKEDSIVKSKMLKKPTVSDLFIEWISNLQEGEVYDKEDFAKTIPDNMLKTLNVCFLRERSTVNQYMISKGIIRTSIKKKGTTFHRQPNPPDGITKPLQEGPKGV